MRLLGTLQNVIVVTGIGMQAKVGVPTTFPAKLAGSGQVQNLVVVHGVDSDGRAFGDVTDLPVKVYGLASSILVPFIEPEPSNEPREDGYQLVGGTSFAVASVTGILATHWSANPSWGAKEIIEKLHADAYPRTKDGVPVAWTGVRRGPPRKGWGGGR
ncbi:hypothetical protein TWF696_003486 [Orbilia brochopaga]|uniref:Peptidase S8/S53 domain-containing protein n=1 Tax=Orbilia brochopaga TaxID=3140254 RepID=A0AAV9TZE7_9PEZI